MKSISAEMGRKTTNRKARLGLGAMLVIGLLCAGQGGLKAGSLVLSSPQNHQIIQRFTKEKGVIPIVGTVDEGSPTVIEARLHTGPSSSSWMRLPATINGRSFQGALTAPAGGWYRLEVRALDGKSMMARAVVEHVGIGEIFVVAGQSNSANYGEERKRTTTGLVTAFDGKRWQPGNDPQSGAEGASGSFMPPFGDSLARRFQVPVGFVACGIGATSVREWLPEGATFPNPPTITGRVRQRPGGSWESDGRAFAMLVSRMIALGLHGFRAVLWHQGESDANQPDSARTLPGDLYQKFLQHIIHESNREIGWEAPWFVAQASYHVPGDEASPDIRAAQKSLWDAGIALEGPDTDALKGDLRENKGQGVHFSGKGLNVHAARWVDKVAPWLEMQLTDSSFEKMLPLPGEVFSVNRRPAFIILPQNPSYPLPWVWYAPTLPGLPAEAERWMFEHFTRAGIAVAGIDVGESYGSPDGRGLFSALYSELTERRGFSAKPVLLGRSRGGLMTLSWAVENPEKVAAWAGIYPVCNIASYPGIEEASRAYHMTPAELTAHLTEHNPTDRLQPLARARIPLFAIHGDVDKLVPLEANSGELKKRYDALGGPMQLIIPKGQGHNMWEGFFQSRELLNLVIKWAPGVSVTGDASTPEQ